VTPIGYKEKLILTTEIHDKVVESSTAFDEQTKQVFKNFSKWTRDVLESNSKTNFYQLKSLTNDLLTYWNESINPDTEKFWLELRKHAIDFERKEPLRFALEKNRFRRVDQGIDARKYWKQLKQLRSIKVSFTEEEIKRIEKIIEEDEQRRLKILEKCLRKKEIPRTQYLKFGECMAYFANCQLFANYFTPAEVEALYGIWKNFEKSPLAETLVADGKGKKNGQGSN
jgi:hypothetical protein